MSNWMLNELNVALNVEWIQCWIECRINMLNELNVELKVEWIECWIECWMNWMLNWMLNWIRLNQQFFKWSLGSRARHGKQNIYWFGSTIRANQSPDLWTIKQSWLSNNLIVVNMVVQTVRYNNYIQWVKKPHVQNFRPQNRAWFSNSNERFDTDITPSII